MGSSISAAFAGFDEDWEQAGSIRVRLNRDWLVGLAADSVVQVFDQRRAAAAAVKTYGKTPLIVLAESDPVQFLGSFFGAIAAHCPVALANPAWGQSEWHAVEQQLQPSQLWSTAALPISLGQGSRQTTILTSQDNPRFPPGAVLIPTGGTSGQVRFVVHTWETLMASVAGFCDYFAIGEEGLGDRLAPPCLSAVNAYCVLPLYHVSGLMQVLRCFATGGTLAIAPFKSLEQGHLLPLTPDLAFLSLVPTQLQRLLRSPSHVAWLTQFHAVLLGGAPAWSDLLFKAWEHDLPLAPTYGMTETASQIATLKPQEFLAQEPRPGWVGAVLPHTQVTICDPAGNALPPGQVGAIAIQSRALALGYVDLNGIDSFATPSAYIPDDLGYLDELGQLHIVGRSSDKIISGGENIFPAEVEAAIRATGCVDDVAVLGMPDDHWGEVVTVVYVAAGQTDAPEEVAAAIVVALGDRLSRHKHPKLWIAADTLPRNAQGKLDRKRLRALAIAQLNSAKSTSASSTLASSTNCPTPNATPSESV